MTVIVKYGIDSHALESISQPTIGQLRANETLKAVLGFGDNVRALIEGVEQSDGLLVPDGVTVLLETRCNTKAN